MRHDLLVRAGVGDGSSAVAGGAHIKFDALAGSLVTHAFVTRTTRGGAASGLPDALTVGAFLIHDAELSRVAQGLVRPVDRHTPCPSLIAHADAAGLVEVRAVATGASAHIRRSGVGLEAPIWKWIRITAPSYIGTMARIRVTARARITARALVGICVPIEICIPSDAHISGDILATVVLRQ
jgi:hypothetical protein